MATRDIRKTRLCAGVPVFPQDGRQDVRFDHILAALVPPTVIMDLRTGARSSFIARGTPPVVAVAVPVDALLWDSHLVPPDQECIVVIQMDSNEDPLRVQAELLGNQLPGEANCALFEVVADTEVAQHLEKGQVLVVAHLVDVGGTEALLAAGHPDAGRRLLPGKIGLEGDHTCAGKQQGRVSRGNQRGAGHGQVASVLKEAGK